MGAGLSEFPTLRDLQAPFVRLRPEYQELLSALRW